MHSVLHVEGMSQRDTSPEDASKQERLITELAAGSKMLEMGLPAKLSPDSMKMVDYWQRELKENPSLIDVIEKDVNNSIDMIHKAERGEKVELSQCRTDSRAKTHRFPCPSTIMWPMNSKNLPNQGHKGVCRSS
jgi:hypothetical protein